MMRSRPSPRSPSSAKATIEAEMRGPERSAHVIRLRPGGPGAVRNQHHRTEPVALVELALSVAMVSG